MAFAAVVLSVEHPLAKNKGVTPGGTGEDLKTASSFIGGPFGYGWGWGYPYFGYGTLLYALDKLHEVPLIKNVVLFPGWGGWGYGYPYFG